MGKETKNGGSKVYDNFAFEPDEIEKDTSAEAPEEFPPGVEKTTWSNSVEFLMSCIAVSVGFGNIWRFPFTAYENGGGAFLIPYVILLFLVGKPFYFLEMIIGQFSSNSSVRVWKLSPGFTGVGYAQLCSTIALITYYSSLMALTLFYLIASFSSELPWSKCREEWVDYCVDSTTRKSQFYNDTNSQGKALSEMEDKLRSLARSGQHRSSAELYFTKIVLQEKESIEDGIGFPEWRLTCCLLGSWLAIFLVTFQGVKSSGKASYFLAIFPYVVLISLFCRAATLEGAADGFLFFITPKWSKLLEPRVWYAAVTQCFFSLSVCFGSIITYSAHNDFKHNIYRDVLIVTTVDSITSTLAGCTIFGILGNLAFEMGEEDIGKVVKSDAGLAFVSYPDAIAKFTVLPQVRKTTPSNFTRFSIFRSRKRGWHGLGNRHCLTRKVPDPQNLADRRACLFLWFSRQHCLRDSGRSVHFDTRGLLRNFLCRLHSGIFRDNWRDLGLRTGKFPERRRVHAGQKTECLLEDLLVRRDTTHSNDNLRLHRHKSVASGPRRPAIPDFRTRGWLFDTFLRYRQYSSLDARGNS